MKNRTVRTILHNVVIKIKTFFCLITEHYGKIVKAKGKLNKEPKLKTDKLFTFKIRHEYNDNNPFVNSTTITHFPYK